MIERSKTVSSLFPKLVLNKPILFPIIFILLLVSALSALQDFFVFFKGSLTILFFVRHLISKLIYFFYLLPVILLIQHFSKTIFSTVFRFGKESAIFLVILILSLFIHQLFSFVADTMLLGKYYKATIYSVIFTNPSVWLDIIIYATAVLGFSLTTIRIKNQENELRCSMLEVELVKTKLYELRSKIHPQFLFNTLNTINQLIESNQNKEANRILSKLSDFLRTTVYDCEREEIRLEEEIEFLNQYLEIEKTSFKNKLITEEKIASDTRNALVPNFILQPLVEEILYSSVKLKITEHRISLDTCREAENIIIKLSFNQALENLNLSPFNESSILAFTHEHLKTALRQ